MGRRIILSSRKHGKHSHFAAVTVAPAPGRPHACSSFRKLPER